MGELTWLEYPIAFVKWKERTLLAFRLLHLLVLTNRGI